MIKEKNVNYIHLNIVSSLFIEKRFHRIMIICNNIFTFKYLLQVYSIYLLYSLLCLSISKYYIQHEHYFVLSKTAIVFHNLYHNY